MSGISADEERELTRLRFLVRQTETVLREVLAVDSGDLSQLVSAACAQLDKLRAEVVRWQSGMQEVVERQAEKHLYCAWDEDGEQRGGYRCGASSSEPGTTDPSKVRCVKCIALSDSDNGGSRESARLDPLRAK